MGRAQKKTPREFAYPQETFGRSSNTLWEKAETPGQKAQLRAARYQHAYAIRIRDAIAGQGLTVSSYAQIAGVTSDHMHKLLRGEAVMSLEDIALADVLVGGVSEFVRKHKSGAAARKEKLELAQAEHLRMSRIAPKLMRSGRWGQEGKPAFPQR